MAESFYDAISEIQPEYDLIVDDYSGPGSSMRKTKLDEYSHETNYVVPDNDLQLRMIKDIRKSLKNSSIIGRRATLEDFEGSNARELEILIMIRNAALDPSRNENVNSINIDSIDLSNMKDSRRSKVLLDAKHFELKPKKLDSNSSSGSNNNDNKHSASDSELLDQKCITETNTKSSKVLKDLQTQNHNKNTTLGTSSKTDKLENSTNFGKQRENEKLCGLKYLTPKELYFKRFDS